jgi:D-glycero-D-manno-heptose 1,7-bisphosphate phosphatase
MEKRRLLATPSRTAQPALFLDRDGVLIEDKHYISNPRDVALCNGAKKLLKNAKQHGWPVIVITNQSGISRGHFDWNAYDAVTDQLLDLLGEEAPLAAIYANGYGPDAASSSWRKPSPAMLHAASLELNIDLQRSLLIGDRLTDLQAGAAAGLTWLGHVQTGHGRRERKAVEHWGARRHNEATGFINFELVFLPSLADFPWTILPRTNE